MAKSYKSNNDMYENDSKAQRKRAKDMRMMRKNKRELVEYSY